MTTTSTEPAPKEQPGGPGQGAAPVPLPERSVPLGLWAVALGALVLRALPLLRGLGPLDYPIDYDEGVYFSASALLWKGVLPYRDYVLVHPPGLLYFLALTSGWASIAGPRAAFAAARILPMVLGAGSTLLVGRLARRWAGPVAGIVAATLYASYPEAVGVERGSFLEPVLNLACLLLATAWLALPADSARALQRATWAGVAAGAALAVKVWAGLWVVAALVSLPSPRQKSAVRFALLAAAVAGVLVAPLALQALGNFFTEVLLFHAIRPPDGVARASRVGEIFSARHVSAFVLAFAGLAAGLIDPRLRRSRPFRFWAAVYALTVAAFFASSSYWAQYNAHLAPGECVLGGLGAATLWEGLHRRFAPTVPSRLPRRFLSLLALAAVAFPGVRRSVIGSRAQAPEIRALDAAVARAVAPDDCLFTFEPGWGVAANRLPPTDPRGLVIVDPYATMLLEASATHRRFPDATAAFQSPSSQETIRERLAQCRFVVLGGRGTWQLSPGTQEWFHQNFQPLPESGPEGFELYGRSR